MGDTQILDLIKQAQDIGLDEFLVRNPVSNKGTGGTGGTGVKVDWRYWVKVLVEPVKVRVVRVKVRVVQVKVRVHGRHG